LVLNASKAQGVGVGVGVSGISVGVGVNVTVAVWVGVADGWGVFVDVAEVRASAVPVCSALTCLAVELPWQAVINKNTNKIKNRERFILSQSNHSNALIIPKTRFVT
jgi:hypothetical protein